MAGLALFSNLAKTPASLRRNEKILRQTDEIIVPSYGAFLAEFSFRRGLEYKSIGA
jgi:hypothetical protein